MNADSEALILEELRVLREDVHKLNMVLLGQNGNIGLYAEHKILWRVHVWLLCTMSAIAGTIGTVIIHNWLK